MYRLLVFLVCVICGGMARAEEDTKADQLLYKEALYHIYNSDYFKALNLLENSHTGATHIGNRYHNLNHLLAIRASLHLGMYRQAEEILDHLDFTSRDKGIVELSRLYRGKLHYQKGEWQLAASQLKNVGQDIPSEHRDEALYYLAMSQIELGETQQATRTLAEMGNTSLWPAYAYYNLAMKYSETDMDPSRALIALRVAASMTNESQEGAALNDRINLAGGYLAFRAEDYSKATSFFQKVRVKGESAPSALYAYGMAYTGLGQNRAAVQMWHRARKYALVIPGVAESFQAIAYGFEQENLRVSAAESYVEAARVYDREITQLDELIAQVRKQGALKVLLEDQPDQDVEWFLLTDVITNTPKAGFVSYVMGNEDFFHRAKTVLELRELQKTTDSGMARLDIFRSMLPSLQRQTDHRQLQASVKRQAKTLNQIIAKRNKLVREVEAAESDLSRQAGLQQIAELDSSISSYRSRLKLFNDRLKEGSSRQADYTTRVSTLQKQGSRLTKELEKLIRSEDQALTEIAVELFEKHRERMVNYRLQSQMALTALLDELAVAQHNRKQKTAREKEGAL